MHHLNLRCSVRRLRMTASAAVGNANSVRAPVRCRHVGRGRPTRQAIAGAWVVQCWGVHSPPRGEGETPVRNVPDRDDSFWQMVGDIVRETSPVMRCCFLTGLGIGVGAAIWFIVPMVSTKAVTAAYGLRGRRLDIAFGALI